MMGMTECTYIRKADLGLIELLAEEELSEELKDYLLEEFGEDGERMRWKRWADETHARCQRRHWYCRGCGECGMAHPYLADTLLNLIVKAIGDVNAGRLDAETGEYIVDEPCEICF